MVKILSRLHFGTFDAKFGGIMDSKTIYNWRMRTHCAGAAVVGEELLLLGHKWMLHLITYWVLCHTDSNQRFILWQA